MSDQEIIKSQAEEIERLRCALSDFLTAFTDYNPNSRSQTGGRKLRLAWAKAQRALATPSGHLVAQIPQNMNNKPGCALGLSDNSSGPRMVRREVLEALVNNPWPSDLLEIRKRVAEEYYRDEQDAREHMDAYCSDEFCGKAIEAHLSAKRNAEIELDRTKEAK